MNWEINSVGSIKDLIEIIKLKSIVKSIVKIFQNILEKTKN